LGKAWGSLGKLGKGLGKPGDAWEAWEDPGEAWEGPGAWRSQGRAKGRLRRLGGKPGDYLHGAMRNNSSNSSSSNNNIKINNSSPPTSPSVERVGVPATKPRASSLKPQASSFKPQALVFLVSPRGIRASSLSSRPTATLVSTLTLTRDFSGPPGASQASRDPSLQSF